MKNRKNIIFSGLRDGLPIGLGYFAVSFSLGIIAEKAGLSALTGFISSFLTRASAGEYGGYTLIAAEGTYIEMFVISLITNLRYLLMNAALTQKFHQRTPMWQRLLVGVCCTDEIFGISIAYDGYLDPIYTYSASAVAVPLWAAGCALGITAGAILPARAVSALGVALYGMFLAIIIPVARKDRAVLLAVIASFLCSLICNYLPFISTLSSGSRTIILTILIASVAAVLKPIDPVEDTDKSISQEG